MARLANPERIFQARRAAVRNSLTGSGMSLETAERWCDAWELEAAGVGLPRDTDHWTAGAAGPQRSELRSDQAGRRGRREKPLQVDRGVSCEAMYLDGVRASGAYRGCLAFGLAVALTACGPAHPMTEYWVRNDSDATAFVQFGGTHDHPETYAFGIPAGGNGILYLLQGWAWRGRIAVLDKQCRAEWEQRIEAVGGEHPFGDDHEGGSLAIGKDRTVTWVSGKPVPMGSTPPPGPWQWFAESTTCGRSVIPDSERP